MNFLHGTSTGTSADTSPSFNNNTSTITKLIQNLVAMMDSHIDLENRSTWAVSDFQKEILNETLILNEFQKALSDKIQKMKKDSDYRGTMN